MSESESSPSKDKSSSDGCPDASSSNDGFSDFPASLLQASSSEKMLALELWSVVDSATWLISERLSSSEKARLPSAALALSSKSMEVWLWASSALDDWLKAISLPSTLLSLSNSSSKKMSSGFTDSTFPWYLDSFLGVLRQLSTTYCPRHAISSQYGPIS